MVQRVCERNHRTLHKSEPAPEGRWNLHGPLHPIAPAGVGLILSSIRWFPLADSLYHRLISAAPPAHSCCPISVVNRTAFSVGRLGQHFHDLQHRIRQPCAEDEALVLGKAIHAVEHPFHVVIPFRQRDRQIRRGQAFLAKKIRPPTAEPAAVAGLSEPGLPRLPRPGSVNPATTGLSARRKGKGKRAKDQRAARRRLRAIASKLALHINTVLVGSGTLATRNPMWLSERIGGM